MNDIPTVIILACLFGYTATQWKSLRELRLQMAVQKEVTAAILSELMAPEEAVNLINRVASKVKKQEGV